MAKGMWVRCPECNNWCYAEKKNFFGRLIRSVTKGDQDFGERYGKFGDEYGMKGFFKTAGRAINAINVYAHGGEMLNGDNYLFTCERCTNEFGTDDESIDMSSQHHLFLMSIELANEFDSVKKQSKQERDSYIKKIEETLAQVENANFIDDAKAILHDLLASCYFYFFNHSDKAYLEINKSLNLYDDPNSHVLKGLFMGNVTNPLENYEKMNELLRINECENLHYAKREDVEKELISCEKIYSESFVSIPSHQRKFLVISSEYNYLPQSFKIIKYNHTDLSGLVFENGFPSNNAIYVCHPFKQNLYYPSESYQADLFRNQLNEFRELLQCLGAKSITTENTLTVERSSDKSFDLNGKLGGGYKGVNGNISGDLKQSDFVMESMIQTMLIDDGFSFNPDISPYVPEGLVWYGHMEEWQRLARMRLRGQNKYSISISSKRTNIVNENEAKQVNAEFKALVAQGDLEISKSSELKVAEGNSHEWKLIVEFYPISEYKKVNQGSIPMADKMMSITNNQNANLSSVPEKGFLNKKLLIILFLAIIAIILVLITFLLLGK